MAKSHIEWTEQTWNPTTGCNKVSQGCKFCYAEVFAKRLQSMGVKKYENGFELTLHPEALNLPRRWKPSNVPFFFKQWGGKNKKRNGRKLNGKIYDQMPSVIHNTEPMLF